MWLKKMYEDKIYGDTIVCGWDGIDLVSKRRVDSYN